MIPRLLRVHNFMCYRDNVPPLDLQGIHLACLAGDNGHGKSALLDAMTWALWGKARRARDDELIHLGQTQMEVELEFELGPHRYRVLRKRDSRRQQSVLELQGWADERWLPLTEPTMRQTQSKIDELLRMDYETFINSAFLVQGRADEFTNKTPGERKRILGEILGLSIYDEVADRAKERAKAKATAVTALKAQLGEIDRELEQRPQYEAQLQEAEQQATLCAERQRSAEAEYRELQMGLQLLQQQQRQLQEVTGRLAQAERELAETAQQLRAAEALVTGFQVTLARREAIGVGYAELLAAREALEGWNVRLAAQEPLLQRRHQADAAIAAARGELVAQQRGLEAQIAHLRSTVQAGEAQRASLADVEAALSILLQQQGEREALRQNLTALTGEIAALDAQNYQLRDEMDELKRNIEMLRSTADPACPLCQQPLDPPRRGKLLADFDSDGHARAATYRANQARLEALRTQASDLRSQDQALERALRALPAQQGRLGTAHAKMQEAEAAAVQLSEATAQLTALSARLEIADYAAGEQAELVAIQAELLSLGYDRALHEAARERVTELAAWDDRHRELDRAAAEIDAAQKATTALQERQVRWQESLAAEEAQQAQLQEALQALPGVSQQLARAAEQVEALQREAGDARLRLGAARQRIDHCERLAKERQVKERERQEAASEQAIYEELREALGRQGLQAMIIEAALPEIEAETNRLLGRMTDGRMSVRLETQRQRKAGGLQETLDLIIADELGPRSYELFSGGEAFRVDFALRVAISKLLARRAGAQLRTLFIDEGFGTQDAQGRERLVEAITAIQDDFDRILVITHIEELKDMFPVRIDVVKTAEGSMVSLS